MTQADATPENNTDSILHKIIRAIAYHPTDDETIQLILQYVVNLAFADGAIFMVFDEAEILIPHQIGLRDITLMDIASEISQYVDDLYIGTDVPDMFEETYTGWMIIPIAHDEKSVGAVIVFYRAAIEMDAELGDMLESLISLLHTVTFIARVKATHNRHNRNRHEFLRIVTHDMRSPLTSMQGFGSMLESQMAGALNEKQERFVEKIMSGIAQLALQIDNMQDAGRYDPETGFYEMSRNATDLIEIVQKVVQNSLLPSGKQNLDISFSADESIPIVNVDSAMIERSVVNLVDNAIKYTPDGEKIEVAVRHDSDDVLITVSDSGYGISADKIDKLFDRHYRVHRPEYKRVKGSGLGLFIVRSVALKHGGDAWAESVESEGSTFFIRIPLDGSNLLGGG